MKRKRRDSGAIGPIYGKNDGYFTIAINFGGSFIQKPQRLYVGGNSCFWDFCHYDEMSLTEIKDMAEHEGFDKDLKFWWIKNGTDLDNEFVALEKDADVLNMAFDIPPHRLVVIYVEHLQTGFVRSQLGTNDVSGIHKGKDVLVDVDVQVGFNKYVGGTNNESPRTDYNDVNAREGSSTVNEIGVKDSDFHYDSGVSDDDDKLFDANVDEDIDVDPLTNELVLGDLPRCEDIGEFNDDRGSGNGHEDAGHDFDGRIKELGFPEFNSRTDMKNPAFKLGNGLHAPMDVIERNSERKKGNNLEDPSWSNLPDDILRKIISALSLVDHIRCRIVCKNWKLLIKDIRPGDKLPWVMLYDWGISDGRIKSVCKLFVPDHQKTYIVEDGYKGEEWRNFAGARDYYSRDGWVLFGNKLGSFPKISCFFFVFSPFSNETVTLPQLDINDVSENPKTFILAKAAFSSSPNSPNCMFFALARCKVQNRIAISLCSRGDLVWKTFKINDIHGKIMDATCFDGTLYCVFCGGTLGAFNVAKQQWSCLYRSSIIPQELGLHDLNWHRLIISDEQILSLVHSESGVWQIWRFESLDENWVRQASSEEQAGFVGQTSFVIPAIEEAGEFAGTVNGFGFRFYSLQSYAKATEALHRTLIQPCDLSFQSRSMM